MTTTPNQTSVPSEPGSLAAGAEVLESMPPSWVTVSCNRCTESWTVDTADSAPVLSAQQVEDLLIPLLDAHDTSEHGGGW